MHLECVRKCMHHPSRLLNVHSLMPCYVYCVLLWCGFYDLCVSRRLVRRRRRSQPRRSKNSWQINSSLKQAERKAHTRTTHIQGKAMSGACGWDGNTATRNMECIDTRSQFHLSSHTGVGLMLAAPRPLCSMSYSMQVNAEFEKAKKDFVTQKKMSLINRSTQWHVATGSWQQLAVM